MPITKRIQKVWLEPRGNGKKRHHQPYEKPNKSVNVQSAKIATHGDIDVDIRPATISRKSKYERFDDLAWACRATIWGMSRPGQARANQD